MQNPARPGRVDSLANFQIYTLAVRSRAGCFGRREKGEGGTEKTASGSDGTRSGSSASYAVQYSIFLRVCACQCLQGPPRIGCSPTIHPLGGSSRFATRANRLKVRSRQCECRDPAFVKTMPHSLVPCDLVRRLLRLGWRRSVLLNPLNLLSLCLVYRRWNFESFVVCFKWSSRSMSWDLWKIMFLWMVVLEFVVDGSE